MAPARRRAGRTDGGPQGGWLMPDGARDVLSVACAGVFAGRPAGNGRGQLPNAAHSVRTSVAADAKHRSGTTRTLPGPRGTVRRGTACHMSAEVRLFQPVGALHLIEPRRGSLEHARVLATLIQLVGRCVRRRDQ